MRFSAQEEYGLRCLLQIARAPRGFMSLHEIAGRESLTQAYVAKLMRALRKGGLVASTRGQKGGYRLARPAEEVSVGSVLVALGGKFYTKDFCDEHAGQSRVCVHDTDCSLRSMLIALDSVVWDALDRVKLKDLVCDESAMNTWVRDQFVPVLIEARASIARRS